MKPSPIHPEPSSSFVPYSKEELDQSIATRFEMIVRSHPRRLAVKSRTGQMTYDELNQAANRIARALLTQRGEVQEPIGLLVEEECRAIGALLGVLKSGKSYVPFNGSAPREKFLERLEDSQVRVLITDRSRFDSIQDRVSNRCMVLAVEDLLVTPSTNNPGLAISPDAVAAIFYTSGSTGRPKGVIQNQRNVLHRAMLTTNACCISMDDRLTLLTAPTYSASLRSLFCALLNGAAIYPFKVVEYGIGELAGWLTREGLTTYQSVPSVFRQWTSNLTGGEDLGKLRLVMLGGEAITVRDVEQFKKHFSSNCFLSCALSSNETGPMRHHFIDKTTEVSQWTVPVGYAVEDKEILILDENGHELGFGQIGEIAVRSAFLSPGYWKQPELTAAAFHRDPDSPDKTIYHTGDLGILQPDGCLLYRGRKDFRVKIRGIRVELEEVEGALLLNPFVKEAVVIAREDGQQGNSRLVAYIVRFPHASLDDLAIRKFLAEKLPDYMVPSAFVFLDFLPHTLSGKVDRQSLPAPQQARPAGVKYVAPRDAIEAALVRMWETMVQVRPISVLDNFFDLGGDSLSASQMIVRIEKEFGKSLPPRAVFQAPSVEQLAVELRQDGAPQAWSSLVKLQSGKERTSVFCVLFAGGFKDEFFSFASLAPQISRDYSFYAVVAWGTDGTSPPHRTVEEMAAAYIKGIKAVQPAGPYFVLGECFSAPVAYETARQLRLGNDAVFLGLLDARMRRHWYYKILGSKLGARVRLRLTLMRDSPTWIYLKEGTATHTSKLRSLPWGERLPHVAKHLVKAVGSASKAVRAGPAAQPQGNIKPNVTDRTRSNFRQRASRAYGLAVRAYLPRPYPGRICIIANEEWCRDNPTLGWSTTGGLDVYRIPGDHNTYLRGHSSMVAEILRNSMAKFERETLGRHDEKGAAASMELTLGSRTYPPGDSVSL